MPSTPIGVCQVMVVTINYDFHNNGTRLLGAGRGHSHGNDQQFFSNNVVTYCDQPLRGWQCYRAGRSSLSAAWVQREMSVWQPSHTQEFS